MKKTVEISDNRVLRSDASNLASFLYYLREKHFNEYQMIRKAVQQVAPFFDDFVLEPLALNKEMLRLEWKHTASDAYFNADSFSDGTLRFISIACLLLQPVSLRPTVVLIDEPELGLHPYAITLLASLVRQACVGPTQIILSTQSALLLDHFKPEEVLVAERSGGGTTLRRLEPAPLEAWLAQYSLGQLWEKNELGGRPTVE
jgi:predicted ATPase